MPFNPIDVMESHSIPPPQLIEAPPHFRKVKWKICPLYECPATVDVIIVQPYD